MNPFDLQDLIGAELKRLSHPKPPDTLLPRVLAVTVRGGHTRTRPRSPWRSQLAVAAVVALVVAGGWALLPVLQPWAASFLADAGSATERSDTLAHKAEDAATVMRVLWDVLLQPAATYVFALALSVTFACALVWTALDRFALRGPTPR